MLKRGLKIAALCALAAYLIFCAAVYFKPQWFFYAPSSAKADLNKAVSEGLNAREVTYQSSDGTLLYGWFVKPSSKDKIIVYFHGNSYNIGAFSSKLVPLVQAGYGVFIGEYRGFGGIEGDINQKNLGADAIAAVKYLYSLGYRNSDLILYGMSLGSYTSINTAYQLGQKDLFAALILEVPFDSVINVVRQRFWPVFPFDLLVKDRYENAARLAQIDIPVLIMAAENDRVVPKERAEALFAAAGEPKTFRLYAGAGHSELYGYKNYNDILLWLEKNEKTK